MHADARKLLWDAQRAAERIARFTTGKTFQSYEGDEFLRSAVERQFEIIGEALKSVAPGRPNHCGCHSGAPANYRIPQRACSRLADVDNLLVWGVVESKLGLLRSALASLLDGE